MNLFFTSKIKFCGHASTSFYCIFDIFWDRYFFWLQKPVKCNSNPDSGVSFFVACQIPKICLFNHRKMQKLWIFQNIFKKSKNLISAIVRDFFDCFFLLSHKFNALATPIGAHSHRIHILSKKIIFMRFGPFFSEKKGSKSSLFFADLKL